MILQQYTVAIWAGFDQFKKIAGFYKSVHDPYIINGLNLVNKMTLQTNVATGYKEIETHSQASQNAVKSLINAVSLSGYSAPINDQTNSLLGNREIQE